MKIVFSVNNYLTLLVYFCNIVFCFWEILLFVVHRLSFTFSFLRCTKGEGGAGGIPGADGRQGHPVSPNTDSIH